MPVYSRRCLILSSLVLAVLIQCGCYSKIQGWSQEAYRTSDPLIEELKAGKLGVLPVMVLEHPSKDEKKSVATKSASAPYTPDRSFESKEISQARAGTDADRLALSEILLRNLRMNPYGIEIISPGECLKCINDTGLTSDYLMFDRNFPRLGVDGERLASFSRATGSRFLLISAAFITENSADSSVTIIWSFGRKSVLRSVKISGQIWDAGSGRKLWEGYAVGYNSMAPYESPPLTEEMMDHAVASFVELLLPALKTKKK